MRTILATLAFGLLAASPAHATGGFLCKTAGDTPVELGIGFGHVPGGPLIGHQLKRDGRTVDTRAAQWWLDDAEMRIVLTDADGMERVAEMRTERQANSGATFDGYVIVDNKRHWIRCYES